MLDGLFQQALLSSQRRQESISISDLESSAGFARTPIDAYSALAPSKNIKLIAEIKRASPSKGHLAEIPDASVQALLYQKSGAHAISVLTEESGFLGRLEDLSVARSAVSIPLLRKDFISSEYQILEARAAGADIVLLIVAGLEQSRLIELKSFTEALGMTAFVETHDAEELARAVDCGARLIGVNARDLSTFETDRDLFGRLRHLIPGDAIAVAESAVRTVADVEHYREAGADVVLVGEALVTNDPRVLLPQFTAIR